MSGVGEGRSSGVGEEEGGEGFELVEALFHCLSLELANQPCAASHEAPQPRTQRSPLRNRVERFLAKEINLETRLFLIRIKLNPLWNA